MPNEKIDALRERAKDAEADLTWNAERFPPAMTPKQFTALLDELCGVGCCERRTRQGETIYVISPHDIAEGDIILEGKCRPRSDPLRTAILRAIGQFHAMNISLERIGKSATPGAIEEINKTQQANRDAIAGLHAAIYDE